MLQVRDGRIDRLGVLFDRHHKMLYNFFLKLSGDRTLSDDLVQEVFLRMLKYRHTYRGESAFRLWMFRIARNAYVDQTRKNGRQLPQAAPGAELASEQPLPSQLFQQAEDARFIKCALDRLSFEKREVLILSRFHYMTYEEIASLLGINLNTVKVRVHRAIHELRAAFLDLTGEKKL